MPQVSPADALRLSGRLGTRPEFVSLAMRVTYTGLAFLATVLLTHLLSPDELGRYFAIIALILLIGNTVQSGWGPFLVREIAALHEQGRNAELAGIGRLAVQIVGGISLLASLVAIGIGVLRHFSSHDMMLLWLAAPIIPLLSTSTVRQAITRGMGHPLIGQLCENATRPGIQVLGLLCWWLGLVRGISGAVTALGIFLAAVAVSALVAYLIERRVTAPARRRISARAPPRSEWLGSLLRNASIGWGASINEQAAILVLAAFGPHAQVALFRVAQQMSLLLGIGLNAVIAVYAPGLSRCFARKDFIGFQTLATKGAAFALVSSVPLAAVYVALGSPVLALVFGAQYSRAYVPLVILTAGQLANALFGIVMTMAIAARSEAAALRAQLIGAGSNVLLCLLLIPSLGAVGAAIASALSLLMWNLILARHLLRNFGIRSFVALPGVTISRRSRS